MDLKKLAEDPAHGSLSIDEIADPHARAFVVAHYGHGGITAHMAAEGGIVPGPPGTIHYVCECGVARMIVPSSAH